MNTGRWVRFVAGGLLNTSATYALYLILNQFLPYQIAYLITYAAGIVVGYVFNSRMVFRVPLSTRRFAVYPLIYVVQYGFSALLLTVCVEYAGLSETMAPLLIIAAMVPASYILNRLALQSGSGNGSPDPS